MLCFIDEHGSVRNETILSDGDELTDKRVRLNTAPVRDDDPTLDLNKRSDKAFVTDGAAIKIDRFHHRDAFTKSNVDDTGLPNHRL